jgi:hypothetical protein
MFIVSRRDRGLLFRRRWISVVLLIAYVATASGVPFPSGARPSNSGELYPCAASVCGCTSADRCWRSCCCHTLSERLAWARKHRVQPPAFVIAEARLAGLDVSWLPHSNMVTSNTSKTCFVGKSKHISRQCCEKQCGNINASQAKACCAHAASKANSSSAKFVIGSQALKCRGQSQIWISAIPPICQTLLPVLLEFPLVEWLGPTLSDTADTIPPVPAIPPPERA